MDENRPELMDIYNNTEVVSTEDLWVVLING